MNKKVVMIWKFTMSINPFTGDFCSVSYHVEGVKPIETHGVRTSRRAGLQASWSQMWKENINRNPVSISATVNAYSTRIRMVPPSQPVMPWIDASKSSMSVFSQNACMNITGMLRYEHESRVYDQSTSSPNREWILVPLINRTLILLRGMRSEVACEPPW